MTSISLDALYDEFSLTIAPDLLSYSGINSAPCWSITSKGSFSVSIVGSSILFNSSKGSISVWLSSFEFLSLFDTVITN